MNPLEEEFVLFFVFLGLCSVLVYAVLNNSPWLNRVIDYLRFKPEEEMDKPDAPEAPAAEKENPNEQK